MRGSLGQDDYRRFLERLARARVESGMSQVEAARRLGRPQSFISKCESGERRVDAVELAYFARLYGVGLDSLLDFIPGDRIRPPSIKGKAKAKRSS